MRISHLNKFFYHSSYHHSIKQMLKIKIQRNPEMGFMHKSMDGSTVRNDQNLNKAYFKNLPHRTNVTQQKQILHAYLRIFHPMVRSKRAVLESYGAEVKKC